jgi:hypothetical protein
VALPKQRNTQSPEAGPLRPRNRQRSSTKQSSTPIEDHTRPSSAGSFTIDLRRASGNTINIHQYGGSVPPTERAAAAKPTEVEQPIEQVVQPAKTQPSFAVEIYPKDVSAFKEWRPPPRAQKSPKKAEILAGGDNLSPAKKGKGRAIEEIEDQDPSVQQLLQELQRALRRESCRYPLFLTSHISVCKLTVDVK